MKSKVIKSLTAICLCACVISGCSQPDTHPFFDDTSTGTIQDTTATTEADVMTTEVDVTTSTSATTTTEAEEDAPSEPSEITTFFNSGTHPDLFYIKSTGFDYTRKTDEVEAIITEGYITEEDKITGCYMLIYPMLGFDVDVFDSYTAGIYSFRDFTKQVDGSYRLDITGEVLENIQQLSASTSMALLAGKAVAEGLTLLDENGNLYTVYNGNLVLVTENGLQGIPEATTSSDSTQEPVETAEPTTESEAD